jgi:hypothetical protein
MCMETILVLPNGTIGDVKLISVRLEIVLTRCKIGEQFMLNEHRL